MAWKQDIYYLWGCFNNSYNMPDTKTLNKRIIIAATLCILHLITILWQPGTWIMLPGVIFYYWMLVYGYISLVRIIMTDHKRTIRYCLPFILVLGTFLLAKFGPPPFGLVKYSFKFGAS